MSERGSDLHRGCLPRLCGALRLSQPLDASFRYAPSSLVSCWYHPWAFRLQRFTPSPSPPIASRRELPFLTLVRPSALDLCSLHRPEGQPSCRHTPTLPKQHRSALTAEAPKRSWLHQPRTSDRSIQEHRGALTSTVQSSSATRVEAPRRSSCHRWAVVRAFTRERRRSCSLSFSLGRPHFLPRRGAALCETPTDHLRSVAPKRASSSSGLESRRRALSSSRPKPS